MSVYDEVIKVIADFSHLSTIWDEKYVSEDYQNGFRQPWLNRLPNDLVFSNPDGSPLQPDSITQAFTRITRSIGLYGVRFHDLRHTHATIMLWQGIHPKIVSERLGHSSIAITLDTYSHVMPGLQEAAVQRFEEGLQMAPADVPVKTVG